MPIDEAIANPTPVKIQDPLEQYNNFLKASYLQSEIGKAKTAANQLAVSNDAWNPAKNPGVFDGQGNPVWNTVVKYNSANNNGVVNPQLLMDRYNAESAKAMANKSNSEATKSIIDATKTTHDMLKENLDKVDLNDPKKGYQQYVDGYSTPLFTHPLTAKFMADSGHTQAQDLAGAWAASNASSVANPGPWKQYMLNEGLGLAKAAEQHFDTRNTGAQTLVTATPANSFDVPATSVSPGSVTANQMTPDQQAQLGVKQGELTLAQKKQADDLAIKQQEMDPTYIAQKTGAVGLTNDKIADFKLQHAAVQSAPTMARHISDTLGLLDSNQAITGSGQTKLLAYNKLLEFFHMRSPGDPIITDTEVLNKNLNKIVIDQLKEGPTSLRTTNMLTGLTKESNASVLLDPKSIESVLRSKLQDVQEQVEKHNTLANELLSSKLRQSMKDLNMGKVSAIPDYGIPQAAVDKLLANPTPGSMAAFDKQVHGATPGMAARLVKQGGGTPTGESPLAPVGQ